MAINMEQFHQTFFEESFEGLDIMESALLNLDVGTADAEVINTIFRAAHSIKGGSGTFGFMAVANFTHLMETLLDEMRNGQRAVSADAVDLLLRAVDCLRLLLRAVQTGSDHDVELVAALQGELQELLRQNVASTAKEAVAIPAVPSAASGWRIGFRPHPDILRTGNEPLRILRELAESGEITVQVDITRLPPLVELDPETCYLSWDIELLGAVERNTLDEVFAWVADESSIDIAPLFTSTASEHATAQSDAKLVSELLPERRKTDRRNTSSASEATSIRVGIDKVDALINMVGELVITQSMLSQFNTDFDMKRVDQLRDGLAQLERNTRELQESVMRIRMLPISFAFNRFPRLVHDLSQKLGKQIELRLSGEQTELDKTVMEKIGDPLVHLVRNALDHGIESPEVRRASGKPEVGIIHLNAYHQGGSIVIEIKDDGAGLNADRILRKARERGLVKPDEALSDEQIADLIFLPGFSTADTVSDVSGRGVGMDVVRRNIKDLGGSVEIRSASGRGSTFTIRLPLTLAILDGQLVRVGGETYIIPLVSIIESLQMQNTQVSSVVNSAELYKLRDEYIPVVRLYDLFGIEPDNHELSGGLLVVVEADGSHAGLLVDELLGQQQIVIKSLETNFRRVDGISGATILGEGTVALILDVPGLVQLSRRQRRIVSHLNEHATSTAA
jgi:two-component system, chemotaxis family, sensor kinase CheA